LSSSTKLGSNGTGFYNWSIPVTQVSGSDYSIKICSASKTQYNDTSEAVFNIQGAPVPEIHVISPSGGETWAGGTTKTVTWSYIGNPGSFVKIDLYKAGVKTQTVAASVSKGINGTGSYNWRIPASMTTGSDYKIRVTSTSNLSYTDISGVEFSLVGPALKVESPDDLVTWQAGTTQTIAWSYTGNPGTYVRIQLLKSGRLYTTIKSAVLTGVGGTGSYQWKLPGTLTIGSDYQIKVQSTSNSTCYDTSDDAFNITRVSVP
jgi:hypothetical protein